MVSGSTGLDRIEEEAVVLVGGYIGLPMLKCRTALAPVVVPVLVPMDQIDSGWYGCMAETRAIEEVARIWDQPILIFEEDLKLVLVLGLSKEVEEARVSVVVGNCRVGWDWDCMGSF